MLVQKRLISCLVAGVLTIVASSSGVLADPASQSPEPPAIQISQEVIADFARMFKVSPDDAALQETFRQLNENLRTGASDTANQQTALRSYNPTSGVQRDQISLGLQVARGAVKKHYRFDGGIPFQEAPPSTLGPEERASIKGAVSYFQGQMMASVNQARATPPLPRCAEDDIEHAKVDSGDPEFDKERVSDFLFLRGPEPKNSSALFGQGVTVISCGSQPGDRCALSSGLLNVRCLPTRLRMSKGKSVRFEGKKALANFNLGQGGKLTPQVAAKLEVFMGGGAP